MSYVKVPFSFVHVDKYSSVPSFSTFVIEWCELRIQLQFFPDDYLAVSTMNASNIYPFPTRISLKMTFQNNF